jgi:hypothetical protein
MIRALEKLIVCARVILADLEHRPTRGTTLSQQRQRVGKKGKDCGPLARFKISKPFG